jgi:hypothetical protein
VALGIYICSSTRNYRILLMLNTLVINGTRNECVYSSKKLLV